MKSVESELICLECGKILPLLRYASLKQKDGSVSYRYCTECRKVTKHIELNDKDFYYKKHEFNQNNKVEKQVVRLLRKKKNG